MLPNSYINNVISMVSHAALVMQKSSRLLWLMVAINYASLLLRKLNTWITRKLIEPSMEDFTWQYALNPEYVGLCQSFVRGPLEAKSFRRYLMTQTRQEKLYCLTDCFDVPCRARVQQLGDIAQSATAGQLVRGGVIGVGQATALRSSAASVSTQVQSTLGLWGDSQRGSERLAWAYDLITNRSIIDPAAGERPATRAKGLIQFEGVRFRYPGRETGGVVLDGASFEVLPGQVLGMTGEAGCGKSTCFKLLERFYDPEEGRILLDGRDIRECNAKPYSTRSVPKQRAPSHGPQLNGSNSATADSTDWLRAQIATVSQEPKLLPVTIRENITFGCAKEPTLDEIWAACKAANIYEALNDKNKFPDGLRTRMGAIQNVSGGEKQRIAIARAILADPPILLLDEATSALDEKNQQEVQASLNQLMKGRTTLVIAHRLSTLKPSSCIVAFEKGKVIESGTHDDLLRTAGSLYAKLWQEQLGSGKLSFTLAPPEDPSVAPQRRPRRSSRCSRAA